MKLHKYFPALPLLLFGTDLSLAADQNGYTARYECRAGGAYCNVDVQSLATRACDQTITPSMPWSSINWSNNTICIAAGDHIGKGKLTIPASANGSASNYKVLRYEGSNNSDPWNQSAGDQARVSQLVINASYWLIHRISFPSLATMLDNYSRVRIEPPTNSTTRGHIFNRLLIEGSGFSGQLYSGLVDDCWYGRMHEDTTIQNSVIRGYYGDGSSNEAIGLSQECGTNVRIVNNEIYDWAAHPIQLGHNNQAVLAGAVIENNDIYFSTAAQTNGGRKIRGENTLSVKASGTSNQPITIINNRIWGNRVPDTSTCCNGSSGPAVAFGAGGGPNSDWILFRNNIVHDSQQGIEWTHWNANCTSSGTYISVVGNIFYQIRDFVPGENRSSAVWWPGCGGAKANEFYLNSIVDTNVYASGTFKENNDFRCNVAISAGSKNASEGSGTQWANNAYYGTSHGNESGSIDATLATRTNNTTYNVGTILRLTPAGSQCTGLNDSGCFLYKVVGAGTSAGSAPAYCTSGGCTTTDGSMVVRAIRGPHQLFRKLRTSPEAYFIPHVRPYAGGNDGAPETYACPNDFASRSGIGINDAN